MKKYKFTILFKNGVEKTFEAEGTNEGITNCMNTTKTVYRDDHYGILTIGNTIINLSDTSYVGVEEIIDYVLELTNKINKDIVISSDELNNIYDTLKYRGGDINAARTIYEKYGIHKLNEYIKKINDVI